MSNFKSRIGQLFIIGFPDERPSTAFLTLLTNEQIGGVILFEENCRTHEIARENIARIRSRNASVPPLVAIDQEGGQVCRLKGAPVQYRAASVYGDGLQLEQFAEEFSRAAVFMEALGINLLLGPVCDIELNPQNRCLINRCFGDSPGTVAVFVETAVAMAKQARLLTCLKHFPGLGAAAGDPHAETVSAAYDESTWEQREQIPFGSGIRAGADMIMTTHLLLPALDNVIATGSARIIKRLIRERLKFDGAIVTDDLTMNGVGQLGNIGERAVAAFLAGHDLLLFGRDTDAAVAAYEYFLKAYDRGDIPKQQLKTALARISGLKFKLDSAVLR